jgi:hypothetical protein
MKFKSFRKTFYIKDRTQKLMFIKKKNCKRRRSFANYEKTFEENRIDKSDHINLYDLLWMGKKKCIVSIFKPYKILSFATLS